MNHPRGLAARRRPAIARTATLIGSAVLGGLAALAPAAALAAPTPTPVPSTAAPSDSAPANSAQSVIAPRILDAEARLDGSGPITAWFGGRAERTYVLTVTNMGDGALTDPPLLLTVGRDDDPTSELARPRIGTIASGQTVKYLLPITLDAPTAGSYYVRATFTDLDEPLVVTTSTSTYPWALLVVGWLLMQPVLLGLYKRRPSPQQDDVDPLGPVPVATAVPVTRPLFGDPLLDDPLLAPPPYGQEPLFADDPLLAAPPLEAATYAEATYVEPTYAQQSYAPPSYPQPTYAQPVHTQPSYAQPLHAEPFRDTAAAYADDPLFGPAPTATAPAMQHVPTATELAASAAAASVAPPAT